ncbi:peptidase M23 [Peribacillus loiseleuriae]|uniref:peptidase M23 n=1 Tax=Peribacillus loiseleuriae TaxID=1679170 RepID=UPI003CFFE333
MGTVVRTFFLVLIWAQIMVMQTNYDSDETATRRLHNGLELAVHDAALHILPAELTEGKIVFDQDVAAQVLKQTFEENLLLDLTLHPEKESFFTNPIKLVYLEYIDHSTRPTGYPFNYFNTEYNLLEVVNGPSIVAVVETTSPRHFLGDPIILRQAVVYEYNGPL